MLIFALLRKTFTNCVLVAARKGGINQFSQPRVARMCFNVGAFFDCRDDVVSNADIQFGVDALTVKIHGHRYYVHVACTLTITQQGALNTVCASE